MTREINATCKEGIVNERTCQRWMKQFEEGNFDLNDQERAGRPSLDIDNQILDYLRMFPRASSVDISTAMNVSQSTIWEHLTRMGLRQVSCRWVPHNLTEGNKETRIRICNELLIQYRNDNFLRRLITVDETWIQWQNVGSYHQTKCWAGGDVSRTKNVSRVLTPFKTLAIFFWDCKGILLWKLLDQGQTITAEVYCNILDELKGRLEEKRRHSLDMPNHGFQLLQDNAHPHTARSTLEKLNDIKLPCLPHPPYSPDLAPSDYYLFSSLKSYLSGNNYLNREEITVAVNNYLKTKSASFFEKGINMLPARWQKCVEVEGDYF